MEFLNRKSKLFLEKIGLFFKGAFSHNQGRERGRRKGREREREGMKRRIFVIDELYSCVFSMLYPLNMVITIHFSTCRE